jgi:uncharacterized protein YndB with AHSA1/START domain
MVLDVDVAVISRSRSIPAPPQAIWDVLADFGSLSSWADDVDHSCILNHAPDGQPVGTTRRVQMGRNTLVERITEFESPVALAYDIEGLPRRLLVVANRWTLRPTGGATEVTLTSRVEIGQNPAARAAEWVVCRGMARESDSMLTGLARRTENTHG